MNLYTRFIIILALLIIGRAFAASIGNNTVEEAKQYQQAYATCSPVVHQMVRQECHFGVRFEKEYQKCMTGQGFSEEAELDPNYYASYMENHKYCRSTAQHAAEESCDYGQRYQRRYHQCMLKYGFNSRGEYIGVAKNPSKSSSAPGKGQEEPVEEEYFEYDS